MKRVLFVDDDPAVLASIKNALRRDRHRWDMVFALGGEAGLVELRTKPFDVVVSDLEMPVVDGAALLAAVKRESPQDRPHRALRLQCQRGLARRGRVSCEALQRTDPTRGDRADAPRAVTRSPHE